MKKLMILICGVAALLCAAFCGCGKQITAQDIYTQCIDNVVEVKAVTEGVGESFGTAEIISTDGTLVTNAHVVTYTRLNAVNTFEEYFIRFSNEEDYRAVTLEKYDSEKDIALLKMSDTAGLDLKPVKTGNSESLKAGEEVYAVGNASNYGIGIFKGIVSIPLINVVLDGVTRSVIQSDLTIAAGNSGGALLNARGELVGITTFRTKDNSGNVIYGIVYSIPINIVLEFINAVE
ncbi:MAG: serine protease [Clostridia bacterium]|nr:serine protease [Clostridia bacterium]